MAMRPTSATADPFARRNEALYRAVLQESAADGGALMGKLVAAARRALQTQESALRDLRERDVLTDAAAQLLRHAPQLCKRYPEALMQAFSAPDNNEVPSSISLIDVQFDELELMDEAQVLNSVTLARIEQVASQVAESSLAELNTLMCAVLGLPSVRADMNPLRPQSYVNALKDVFAATGVSGTLQLLWLNAMCVTMGQELRTLYANLCLRLRNGGVAAATYARPGGANPQGMGQAGFAPAAPARGPAYPPAYGVGAAPAYGSAPAYASAAPAYAQPSGRDEVLLTLDKLRRLLSGELDRGPAGPSTSHVRQFADQFARPSSAGQAGAASAAEFDITVPASLNAQTEMKQVHQVVQGLQQRRSAVPSGLPPQSIEGQRHALRESAADAAQALSLEVVSLMVENMAHDPRLLEPVRRVIRQLEPALLRLALGDLRFFTDKQHPARRLLQELTHHSMAFKSVDTKGFDAFVRELQNALAPLLQADPVHADLFAAQLQTLQQRWSLAAKAQEKERELAVEVLQHAEARNLLAEKIAMRIETHKDSAKVPPVVIEFLCGPWAQVVAQARIKQGAGSAAAEKYEALIPALLWSAHPELARSSPSKLTRVVPRVLSTLREGLETIQYPGTRTSSFLEALMAIHQQIFRSIAGSPAQDTPASTVQTLPERVRPVADGNPWIAPQEALASHFVDLSEAPPELLAEAMPDAIPEAAPAAAPDLPIAPAEGAEPGADFPLGSWVELWANDQWLRTQLTWASPHGTLFLFTSVVGATQSMTRRSRDKLLATGKLRLVSGQSVDQGALDAVAQMAMRNSVQGADTVI